MPLFDKNFPDATCRCGRSTQYVHCPACGSANCERRLRAPKEAPFALKNSRWWFCKRCTLKFSDEDRMQHCEAPSRAAVSAPVQRAIDKVVEQAPVELSGLTREERLAKLGEMFGKKK